MPLDATVFAFGNDVPSWRKSPAAAFTFDFSGALTQPKSAAIFQSKLSPSDATACEVCGRVRRNQGTGLRATANLRAVIRH